ncbi:hypothetical protein [Ahrensia marina]|jgi:hypothetical protein|uniref:hypothetical protein n=1 Tax=Ahrensia marina TaxID=1514904 RepID=UPI000B11ABA0|nr:hypothetical protein [Ahrensia marina]
MKIKSAFSRIADAFSTPTREQAENSYLERSISLADLERRQNEIARGKFRNF